MYMLISSPYLYKIGTYFPNGLVAKHPLIELFLSCLAQSGISNLPFANPILNVERLNSFINSIRTEAKKQTIAKKIKHRNDTVNKNYNELNYYITKLLAHYPEVSIIWFELNYNPRESSIVVTSAFLG